MVRESPRGNSSTGEEGIYRDGQMSRKQGKLAAYLWSHAGIAVRPRGLGSKMHVEARGKAAILVIMSWAALVGLLAERACG